MNEILQSQQYLSFRVNDQTLGVDILKVKEIVESGRVTTVPMMQTSIRGVINLRGSVVPVLDLSARFEQGPCEANARTCIVIIEQSTMADHQLIGLMVDAVNAVMDVSPEQISPPPQFGAGIQSDFISGIAKMGDDFILLLHIDSLCNFSIELKAQTEQFG